MTIENDLVDNWNQPDKISEQQQYNIDRYEYQSKGDETDYMKYPPRAVDGEGNVKHFDVRHMEDRRGWKEYEAANLEYEKKNPRWWDVDHGADATYDSRGNKIGFDQFDKDMRPKGERLSDDSRRSGAMETQFRADYARANPNKNNMPLKSKGY